ncbi:MAG: transcription termination factor Rho [Firmicutes bacterium]|uniref:Transcription termination factor Rho n=1 Tax=Candidatus Stercoripulliclostridium pullicola TaxID=2840953 RepID=A0A940ICK0_9FIRM|nr:transcription termination factor Rho [Candidatus Stercoripulliclostridium pullicola]
MVDFYTAEQLTAMGIFQLRDLARKLGHHSPTDKRKQELIDFILAAKDIPVKSEEPQKKRRGRPPKAIMDVTVPDPAKQESTEAKPAENAEKSDKPVTPRKSSGADSLPYDATQVKSAGTVRFGENGFEPRRKFDPKHSGNNGYFNNGKHDKSYYDANRASNSQSNNEDQQSTEEMEIREGVLEICPDGYGFLRAHNYEQGEGDAYIAAPKIRKSGLRKGDLVRAYVKKLAENRPMNVQEIISVNGDSPESAFNRPAFENLIPVYPDERFKLELATSSADYAIRAIDLVAPIGKGQRAMIVSPPKAGKTTLLKKIAHSIAVNYPDAHLMVLLVDERPEEVTDMQRSIKGEVIYSTFDEMPEHHTKASEMVLERAKRLVERGRDVVILMDSLTRLARAYNLVITPTGKTLSGGVDPGALHSPKRFFGAARNIENGGSLTIIATALIDTGSRMDDVIYEEFKGTGNMEIHLDRKLSEKRIFPAIDLNRSGTRREELLLDQKELEGIWAVRKMLSAGDVMEATENLIQMMMKTKNNKEFIEQLTLQIVKLQKDGFNFA